MFRKPTPIPQKNGVSQSQKTNSQYIEYRHRQSILSAYKLVNPTNSTASQQPIPLQTKPIKCKLSQHSQRKHINPYIDTNTYTYTCVFGVGGGIMTVERLRDWNTLRSIRSMERIWFLRETALGLLAFDFLSMLRALGRRWPAGCLSSAAAALRLP